MTAAAPSIRACPVCGVPVGRLIDDFAPPSVSCPEHGPFTADGRPYRRTAWTAKDGSEVIAYTPTRGNDR